MCRDYVFLSPSVPRPVCCGPSGPTLCRPPGPGCCRLSLSGFVQAVFARLVRTVLVRLCAGRPCPSLRGLSLSDFVRAVYARLRGLSLSVFVRAACARLCRPPLAVRSPSIRCLRDTAERWGCVFVRGPARPSSRRCDGARKPFILFFSQIIESLQFSGLSPSFPLPQYIK